MKIKADQIVVSIPVLTKTLYSLFTLIRQKYNIFQSYNTSAIVKLEGCIVLNEHNTVLARSGPLYATGVSLGSPESSTQTASRSLQPFLL